MASWWPPLAVGDYERICADCGGSGVFVEVGPDEVGPELVACPRCDGEGVRISRPQNPSAYWSGE